MRRKHEYLKVTLIYSECKAVNKETVCKAKLKKKTKKQNKIKINKQNQL